ncbi:MAG TPA: PsiF family protein [Burkholderiales bacterium]|nr:PsiF family protein [Burkholderiales bacterium]
MKTVLALAVALTCFIGTAHAQDAKPTSQQEKMKWCNQQAKTKELKGDQRKAFMSECLRKEKKS